MADQAFLDHIAGGLTTLSRCWLLRRRDGWVRGFTDHDADLKIDGVTYVAETGLTPQAIMQTTGLAIDNSEAVGALSAAAISEVDIRAGRFDGASVEAWLVNWADTSQRMLQFRGHLGEISRAGGAFRAELLGLTEALNQPQVRIYQKACSAVLGDARCKVDLDTPGYRESVTVVSVEDGVRFVVTGDSGQPDRYFDRGRLRVVDGAGAGLLGVIKTDRASGTQREITLWASLRSEIAPGDMLSMEAGCNKTKATCRDKFDNLINFRGFPNIPGENRLMSVPVKGSTIDTTGGAK